MFLGILHNLYYSCVNWIHFLSSDYFFNDFTVLSEVALNYSDVDHVEGPDAALYRQEELQFVGK